MKTIAVLRGPEFLRACNRVRHAVEQFVAETGVMELRKVMPVIPEGATEDEKRAAILSQSKKNISAMLDRMLDEKPEATYKLLCALIVPEKKKVTVSDADGKVKEVELDEFEEPDGMDLITAGLELVSTPKVMDFLLQLARSAQTNTEE